MIGLQVMPCLLKFQIGKNREHCMQSILFVFAIKFIYSEKATKFCKIFTLLLSYVAPAKNKVEISQNFVAFSECMNFDPFSHFGSLLLLFRWNLTPPPPSFRRLLWTDHFMNEKVKIELTLSALANKVSIVSIDSIISETWCM